MVEEYTTDTTTAIPPEPVRMEEERQSYEGMSSEEIREEIEQTRDDMGDTLDAITRKLSPGELLDRFLQYARGPKGFARNLGQSIKENPVPVTLIGIGLAWLMAATSGEHRTRTAGVDVEAYPPSEQRGVKEKMGEAMHSVREKVSGVSQSIKDTAGKMKEKAYSAREKTQQAGQRISDTASGAGQQAGRLGSATRHQATRVKEGISYMWHEHPITLAAIGLALGAAVGAMFPSTRIEDETMGEARDRLKEKAREMGEEQLEKGKEAARAAGEAAQEELKGEG